MKAADATAPTGSPDSRSWQRRPSTQVVGALAVALPMAGIAWWVATAQDDGMTLRTLFLGPMVGGGGLLFWILFLQVFVCGEGLDELGFRRDRPALDVGLGAGLAAVTLAFHFAFGATVATLFPARPPAPAILELLTGVARDPVLLAIWLGPVVWIGVALFEETARAFLLRRLWQVWPGTGGRWGGILAVSLLTGLGHVYQGPAAVISIGLKSVLLGWVYLRTGRIRALIVAHGLYDSVQIVLAVIAIRQIAS